VDLPDVNVWLALSVSHHPHHARAMAYWSAEAQAEVSFCRVTMLGLLRLLTQPRVMDAAVLTPGTAMKALQRWRRLPEVSHRAEPATLDATFEQLLTSELTPRLLTDAYLAAHALAGGMRLVSFDRDFRRFPDLDLLLLSTEDAPT
jgi:hypothetical protein